MPVPSWGDVFKSGNPIQAVLGEHLPTYFYRMAADRFSKPPRPTKTRLDPSFFESVYDVVRQIPRGRVTSYGAIARFLGSGKSARMVGWAMNAATGVMPPVPAQRVVNSSGLLTGKFHFGPGDEMKQLLENDGVPVEKDKVKDFTQRFWDPRTLLDEI